MSIAKQYLACHYFTNGNRFITLTPMLRGVSAKCFHKQELRHTNKICTQIYTSSGWLVSCSVEVMCLNNACTNSASKSCIEM